MDCDSDAFRLKNIATGATVQNSILLRAKKRLAVLARLTQDRSNPKDLAVARAMLARQKALV